MSVMGRFGHYAPGADGLVVGVGVKTNKCRHGRAA